MREGRRGGLHEVFRWRRAISSVQFTDGQSGDCLSIHDGLYTCGVFVLLCLFTKSAMDHITIAGTGWSVHKGLDIDDVIPQQARWSVR